MSNTTDREQLELAAKAAGLPWAQWVEDGDASWNPLTDDGDRYRLAKAMNMTIEFDTCTVGAKLPNGNWMWIGWSEKDLKGLHKTDADAILALAAEIGRQMP